MSQLQQALSTRDEFLASVSHDLKNPIASIKGMAQLLERRLTRSGSIPHEQVEQTLRTIDAVATRAGTQVEELLDIARMRLDRPLDVDREPTDLVALVGEVVAEYRQRSDGRLIHFDAAVPTLVGAWDRRRLARALGNLLENALKYSPPDSPVLVRVTFEADGVGWGVLTVQDQGVGIPAEELDNIFQRFKRGTNVAASKLPASSAAARR
jgi:signal transduction histidine kinase